MAIMSIMSIMLETAKLIPYSRAEKSSLANIDVSARKVSKSYTTDNSSRYLLAQYVSVFYY